MVTAPVIVGSDVAGAIECTPAPEMPKKIWSVPVVTLAWAIAARRVQWPVPSSQTVSTVFVSVPSPVESTTKVAVACAAGASARVRNAIAAATPARRPLDPVVGIVPTETSCVTFPAADLITAGGAGQAGR